MDDASEDLINEHQGILSGHGILPIYTTANPARVGRFPVESPLNGGSAWIQFQVMIIGWVIAFKQCGYC